MYHERPVRRAVTGEDLRGIQQPLSKHRDTVAPSLKRNDLLCGLCACGDLLSGSVASPNPKWCDHICATRLFPYTFRLCLGDQPPNLQSQICNPWWLTFNQDVSVRPPAQASPIRRRPSTRRIRESWIGSGVATTIPLKPKDIPALFPSALGLAPGIRPRLLFDWPPVFRVSGPSGWWDLRSDITSFCCRQPARPTQRPASEY